ncbi:MAG: chromosomal replication initiator DnaA [Rhodospirillales bacterium]|nr:chromosomal replication initiator DnaA [Rhodospirillales bacterium]
MTARQLVLPLPLAAADLAREPLVEMPSNEAARQWLAAPERWSFGRLVLWGGPATGKSHFLAIWAEGHGGVPWCGAARPAPPAPIIVDDADLIDEAALFHLLNAAAEGGQLVLLAAREPPSRWRIALPDLASRLRASSVIGIGPPEDALLEALFARLLDERHLAVAPALRVWLLRRAPRDPGLLRELAARLDHASLALGRRVTRTMAAAALAELVPGEGPPGAGPDADEDLTVASDRASPIGLPFL